METTLDNLSKEVLAIRDTGRNVITLLETLPHMGDDLSKIHSVLPTIASNVTTVHDELPKISDKVTVIHDELLPILRDIVRQSAVGFPQK